MEKLKTKNKKLSRSALILIISSAVILIPILIFAIVLLTSSIGTHKPQLGSRFKNDLNPAISATNKSNIESEVEALSNVEKVEVNLPTAELRVYIDAKDSCDKDQIKEIADEAYDIVDKEIPISKYFTASSDGKKMYDLEITVYNYNDGDEDGMIIYSITKNSKMDEPSGQYTSEPISPETAASVTGQSSETVEEVEESETTTTE